MSNNGINLLSKKEDVSIKERKRIKVLQIIAGFCLGITALTILILIFLYTQVKISTIKKDQDSAIKNMTYLHEKSAKLNAVNDRLWSISEVIKNRKDFQATIETLSKQVTGQVKLNGIDISSTVISMRLSSTSLEDTKVFVDRMITLATTKKTIKDLTIETFAYDTKNDRYYLSISADLL
jgi:hypothetical protein